MPSTDEFTSFGNPELAVWSNRMQGRPGGDPHLVDRLRRGDPRAFEELVIAYQHRGFGVALRMLRNRGEAGGIAPEGFLRGPGGVEDFPGEAKAPAGAHPIHSPPRLNR